MVWSHINFFSHDLLRWISAGFLFSINSRVQYGWHGTTMMSWSTQLYTHYQQLESRCSLLPNHHFEEAEQAYKAGLVKKDHGDDLLCLVNVLCMNSFWWVLRHMICASALTRFVFILWIRPDSHLALCSSWDGLSIKAIIVYYTHKVPL